MNKKITLLVDGQPVPLGWRTEKIIRALSLIDNHIQNINQGGLDINWRGDDLSVVPRHHFRFKMPRQ